MAVVRGTESPLVTVDDAIAAVAIADAVRESLATGKPVEPVAGDAPAQNWVLS
jgi:predicted dehydrogenase